MAWWLVGLMVFVDTVWFLVSDYEMSLIGMSRAFIGIVLVGIPLLIYGTLRYDRKIVSALSSVLLLIGFSVAAAPLSYLFAGLDLPLWDETLHRWDQALGIDWRSYLAWTNEHPLIGVIFTLAYRSLMPQMVAICLLLAFAGRYWELRVFNLAVVLSGVLCVLLSALMPAMAMYVQLGLKPHDFPNLSPAAAYVHVDHILGLRDGSFRFFELDKAEGIITFPSYHASLAVIFLAGLWTVPLLRWPGAALNLLVIAATPIDGGHYFVDVGAGIAIAVSCLLIARHASRIFRWEDAVQTPAPTSLFGRSKSWAT
ncbi:phosphatase PAP2 family protein [Microvirga sp. P5_D2]